MGPYLVFLASTVNGYEGTGRSLSLKLINDLRKRQGQASHDAALTAGAAVAGAKGKKVSSPLRILPACLFQFVSL